VDAAAPEDEKKDADEDEGEAEADPEAQGAPVAAETEIASQRKAKQPVGEEVAEHGSAGVAGTAQATGGNGLEAVEELERRARGKEDNGVADDSFVGGVNAGDVAREYEQGNTHAEHEAGTENNRGIAGKASGGGITTADGLSDANGSG